MDDADTETLVGLLVDVANASGDETFLTLRLDSYDKDKGYVYRASLSVPIWGGSILPLHDLATGEKPLVALADSPEAALAALAALVRG